MPFLRQTVWKTGRRTACICKFGDCYGDEQRGDFIREKINDKHYPASITKLLTALVALENADPDDEVYFSEDSVSFLEYGDASIGMRPGEILSMNDALYGMLLASANEVSYAIAESVGKKMGGGFETFIQKMNERCEELGCTGSHWTNANGLHDENIIRRRMTWR